MRVYARKNLFMSLLTVSKLIEKLPTIILYGVVRSIQGLLIRVAGNNTHVSVGVQCRIQLPDGEMLGEIVGFEDDLVLVMPYGALDGIHPGTRVDFELQDSVLNPCEGWLGRVLNGLGEPVDGLGLLPQGSENILVRGQPPSAHQRHKVSERIGVGLKAVNTFLTVCRGQRLGVFAGSGVGKSMLLSMLARYTHCDVCVIGLIGERGREVREFIEDTLGEEGLKKSVLIVATSDESPLMRRRAAYTTMAVAEYYRNQGLSVLCLMDSVTRLAMAQREIGLSTGEPPTTKGYTPSVFVELARVLERAGPGINDGDITAFFTVLVDGDDHNEPIADAVRGILDGHIVLERAIAERGHYPAINILKSLSRMVPACHSPEEQSMVIQARQYLSIYEDMADMIRLGAYRPGSNPQVDEAIEMNPKLMAFLGQHHKESFGLEQSFSLLREIIA